MKIRSPSRRGPPILVIAIVVGIVLLAGLVWQPVQVQKQAYATADKVLTDYAELAARELEKRFVNSLGRSEFYPTLLRWCPRINNEEARAVREALRTRMSASGSRVASTYFRVSSARIDYVGEALDGEVAAWLSESLAEDGTEPWLYRGQWFRSPEKLVVYLRQDEAEPLLCGFVVDSSVFATAMTTALEQGPLVPDWLAGGGLTNDLVVVSFLDPERNSLAKVVPPAARVDGYIDPSRFLLLPPSPFDYDPQQLLKGFALQLGFVRNPARAIVAGDTTARSLRWLIPLAALAFLLLVAAAWLLARERSLLRMREDFVSEVSHELRTPLAQIRLFAETLKEDRFRNASEQQRAVNVIDREARRLSQLVENVLRVSRVQDRYRAELTETDIEPFVRDVCESFGAVHADISVRVRAEDIPKVDLDRHAMRQVLLNLLDNARKYGPAEQEISVDLRVVDDEVELAVEDQGPGIPRDERERVWQTFYRGGDAGKSGTGIGLAVVRELVEAMGGSVFVLDGKSGARVGFRLPLRGRGR